MTDGAGPTPGASIEIIFKMFVMISCKKYSPGRLAIRFAVASVLVLAFAWGCKARSPGSNLESFQGNAAGGSPQAEKNIPLPELSLGQNPRGRPFTEAEASVCDDDQRVLPADVILPDDLLALENSTPPLSPLRPESLDARIAFSSYLSGTPIPQSSALPGEGVEQLALTGRVQFPKGTVGAAAVPYSNVKLDLPVWRREDVMKAFCAIRDSTWTITKSPGPLATRRLTWLFPDDSCYARAQVANGALKRWGFPPSRSVFSLGNLKVNTVNHPDGMVTWTFHVAPAVATDEGVYVLDPALEPRFPLQLDAWVRMQSLAVKSVDEIDVAVCSPGAANPAADACISDDDGWDQGWAWLKYPVTRGARSFFDQETERQRRLGRDPRRVLGDAPPWRRSLNPKSKGDVAP